MTWKSPVVTLTATFLVAMIMANEFEKAGNERRKRELAEHEAIVAAGKRHLAELARIKRIEDMARDDRGDVGQYSDAVRSSTAIYTHPAVVHRSASPIWIYVPRVYSPVVPHFLLLARPAPISMPGTHSSIVRGGFGGTARSFSTSSGS